LQASAVLGELNGPRNRILSEEEMFAYWRFAYWREGSFARADAVRIAGGA
jgi:hypothetical protein